jgi:hypothetical protein
MQFLANPVVSAWAMMFSSNSQPTRLAIRSAPGQWESCAFLSAALLRSLRSGRERCVDRSGRASGSRAIAAITLLFVYRSTA